MRGYFWLLIVFLTVVVGTIIFGSNPAKADTLAYQGVDPGADDGAGDYMPSGY